MKKIISMFAIAVAISACSNKQTSTTDAANIKATLKKEMQDSIKLDSFKRVEAKAKEDARVDSIAQVKATQTAALKQSTKQRPSAVRNTEVKDEYYEQSAPKKKGWSAAAKGTAIGAGAGAITGALIDHKHGRGAIIGGLVGGGAGYVIGRNKDKQTGRAQ